MPSSNVRLILHTSGRIIVDHRADGVYDATNYPVPLGEVADVATIAANDATFKQVNDVDRQVTIVGSAAVINLAATPNRILEMVGAQISANTAMDSLDGWGAGDFNHPNVKTYLEAIADLMFPERTNGPVTRNP